MPSGLTMTVSQLNQYLGNMLKDDPVLRNITVRGEISNFHRHSSGHLYFSLKDESALIRCVMFRQSTMLVRFQPENGMQVSIEGYISLYARDGQLQLYCEHMKRDGVGDLYIKFEQLKQKLMDEGLFDAANKRPLPPLPRAVGVVTSPTGAAVQDILRVSLRRHPGLRIVVVPVRVQGDGAAKEIAEAIRRIVDVPDVDVLIVGRGGGSIEDLWAFNEEIVARAIAECPIPVVSGVGHETDFTIADFCADVRAATPSNAAELAVPESVSMIERRERAARRMCGAILRQLASSCERAQRLRDTAVLRRPEALLAPLGERVKRLKSAIYADAGRRIAHSVEKHAALRRHLEALNPTAVLLRGYSILFDQEGNSVHSVNDIMAGQAFEAMLCDGRFSARREG